MQQPGNYPPPTVIVRQTVQNRGCMSGCGAIIGGIIVLVIVAGIFNSLNGNSAKPTATPTRSATPTSAVAAQPTITVGPTATATIAPIPTAAPMVVTVKDNPVNVRQAADQNAPVVTTVDVGLDLFVLGPDTTGSDGQTRWMHVAANDTTGYVRSDLVSAPHAPSPPTPTVAPTPTQAMSAADSTGAAAAAIKGAYPAIDAADLSKRPDFYKGKQFRIQGRIANVAEQNGITAFIMFADTAAGGTVPIAVGFKGTDTHIQEDVRLLAYCTGVGTISGKNSFGATVTEAACTADYLAPG